MKPRRVLTIILFLIGIAICAVLLGQGITRRRAQAKFAALSGADTANEAKNIVPEEADPVLEEGNPDLPDDVVFPDKMPDWDALWEENEDIYAWITVPGTNVDYPVLQNEEELDYYLDHNLDHSTGYPGCIYTRYHNSRDFEDPNTVIYGHNMKDGSMFKTLHSFEDGAFFEENKYLFIYQPGRTMVYEIFAAYSFTDADLLSTVDFEDPEVFQNYLDSLINIRSLYVNLRKDTFAPLDKNCRIVTLSTCIAGADEVRYLVQAVRIGDINES